MLILRAHFIGSRDWKQEQMLKMDTQIGLVRSFGSEALSRIHIFKIIIMTLPIHFLLIHIMMRLMHLLLLMVQPGSILIPVVPALRHIGEYSPLEGDGDGSTVQDNQEGSFMTQAQQMLFRQLL